MSWLELVVETASAQSALVEQVLEDCGAQALTLNDAGDEPVLEPLPGETPLWTHLRITALFGAEVNCKRIEQNIHSQLPGVFVQWRALKDRQWERVWLDRFKPTQYGRRLWIIPRESQAVDEQAVNIFMDPGLAFGTGDHPTTNLCLQWLDRTSITGKRLLDYGHGSGVLAIAANKLGARDVVGVDIDPQAIIAGHNNATRNGIDQGILFTQSAPTGNFDLVIANILAAPLMALARQLSTLLVAGGNIALSGVLTEQASQVREAYAEWIRWDDEQRLDDWVLISGVRLPSHPDQPQGSRD